MVIGQSADGGMGGGGKPLGRFQTIQGEALVLSLVLVE